MTAIDTFTAITAGIDNRLSPNDRHVLATIARWPHSDITLDELCRRLPRTPRPNVFSAVARLEDYGYLPTGAIR